MSSNDPAKPDADEEQKGFSDEQKNFHSGLHDGRRCGADGTVIACHLR